MPSKRDMSQAPYDRRPQTGYDHRGQTPAIRNEYVPEGTPGVLTPRGTFHATKAATPFPNTQDLKEWSTWKKFFLVWFRFQTYKSVVYPFVSFFFDVFNFLSVVLGFAISVPLFFIWIGFPIFAMFIKLWRASGLLQRWLAFHMTGKHPVYRFNDPNRDHRLDDAVRHRTVLPNDLESGGFGSYASYNEDDESSWETEEGSGSYYEDDGGKSNKNKKKARFADSESESEYEEDSDDYGTEDSDAWTDSDQGSWASGSGFSTSQSLPTASANQPSAPPRHKPSNNFFVGIWEGFKHDYRDPFTWRAVGTFVVKFPLAVIILGLNLVLVLLPLALIFFALIRETCSSCVVDFKDMFGLTSMEFPWDDLTGNLAVLLPAGIFLSFFFLNLNTAIVYGAGSLYLKMHGYPRSKTYLDHHPDIVWVPMPERQFSRAPSNMGLAAGSGSGSTEESS